MGSVWRYPRPLVEHAARLANVSERTVRRWCLAGMDLHVEADILRFKKGKGTPGGLEARRQKEDEERPDDPVWRAWFNSWLATHK
jgi:hypothetical protein